MASSLFDDGRAGFLSGEIVWKSGGSTIKAFLVRGYTYDASHKFVSDITGAGGTLVATSAALTSLTNVAGVADAADVTFTSVPAGAAIPAIVLAQTSAVEGGADVASSAQRVIAHIDTATGLPVTPNGQNVSISWDNGSNRVFKL